MTLSAGQLTKYRILRWAWHSRACFQRHWPDLHGGARSLAARQPGRCHPGWWGLFFTPQNLLGANDSDCRRLCSADRNGQALVTSWLGDLECPLKSSKYIALGNWDALDGLKENVEFNHHSFPPLSPQKCKNDLESQGTGNNTALHVLRVRA